MGQPGSPRVQCFGRRACRGRAGHGSEHATHVDFAGRVVAQRNFTSDNDGDVDDATDGQGHGTNVGGIIAANGDHIGIAPQANLVPIKVLSNQGGGSFSWIDDALQWVIDHREEHNITAVCMSLGDGGNYTSDSFGLFASAAPQRPEEDPHAARDPCGRCDCCRQRLFQPSEPAGHGLPRHHPRMRQRRARCTMRSKAASAMPAAQSPTPPGRDKSRPSRNACMKA